MPIRGKNAVIAAVIACARIGDVVEVAQDVFGSDDTDAVAA